MGCYRLSSSMGSNLWPFYFGNFFWTGYTSIIHSYGIGYTTILCSYLKHQDASPPLSQSSSCQGHERSFAPFSCLKESVIQPSSLLSWLLCCFPYVARPAFVLEGCSLETSFSVSFNGYANWCFVTPVLHAISKIVLLALVADSITSNISLSVFWLSKASSHLLALGLSRFKDSTLTFIV
ncbi:unnamed protein product [Arabidopsis halleri]